MALIISKAWLSVISEHRERIVYAIVVVMGDKSLLAPSLIAPSNRYDLILLLLLRTIVQPLNYYFKRLLLLGLVS